MPTTTEPQEAASAATPLEPGEGASPTAPHAELRFDEGEFGEALDLEDVPDAGGPPGPDEVALPEADRRPTVPQLGGAKGEAPRGERARRTDRALKTDPAPRTDPSPSPRTDPSLSSAPAADPYLGAVIADRYRIESKIGEGGMGAVYLAVHHIIERKVALKILSQDFARKPDLVQRFMQEARAAARIGHENIVEVYDFGETESRSVFFAMEYLEGHDLAHVIRTQAPLPAARVRHIALQVCRALGAAHGKQIIHRDLKPENVFLVDRDGRTDFVKVLDFGIAKFSNIEEEKSRLTRTGMIFGTPEYMSPEQARGDAPDHRVDIYALGCMLYEMLTGTVPFSADTFMGVLTKHMFEPVEPPSRRAGVPIPPELEQVVMRALEKDRERRFQSMQELALALEGELVPQAVPSPVAALASQRYAAGQPGGQPLSGPLQSGEVPLGQGYPSSPAALAAPVVYPAQLVAGYLPHAGDRTAQSSLPARRRKLAVIGGAVGGAAVLALVLLFYNTTPPQPVVSTSGAGGAVGVGAGQPQPQPRPEVPAPAAVAPRPRAAGHGTLLLSGTPGARVELLGEDRGEIPHKGPLRLEVDLRDGGELRASVTVRKRDFVDESREVVLSAERQTALDIALQPKRRRSGPSAGKEKEPQRTEPHVEPPKVPPGQGLRNPFR